PAIQVMDNVDQANGVHVKDRGRIRIVAKLGRVSGDADEIVKPSAVGAQQFGLHAEHIAIAAGEVENGFYSHLLLHQNAKRQIAHAGGGAGAVRNVDGINAGGFQVPCTLNLFAEIHSLRSEERRVGK